MRKKGFTILELMVALAVLSVVLFIAYGAIVNFMRARSDQDTIVNLQQKLRRVLEVVTQDLRSNVLGAISDEPYPSGNDQISFALLKGTAGYLVLPHDSGNNASFKRAAELKFIANRTPTLQRGDYALMVNQNGQAVIFKVTRVNRASGPRWHLVHAGCGNTIDYTSNTLLFEVSVMGLRHDSGRQELVLYENGQELPFAFDISKFTIDYIYQDPTTNTEAVNPTGYNPPDSPPLKKVGSYELRRLRLTLEASAKSRGRTFKRRYVGLVDLPRGGQFNISKVVKCQ